MAESMAQVIISNERHFKFVLTKLRHFTIWLSAGYF